MTATASNTGAPARALFVRVGETLYGERWQHRMALGLGVSVRIVRYWSAGERGIPESRWLEIDTLLDLQATELRKLRRQIAR